MAEDSPSSSVDIATSNGSINPDPSLSLLLSHLNSLVTVKLDSSNYIIWKSQFQNLMRAAGLLGYITGSTPSPSEIILDAQNQQVRNPNFSRWEIIDAHIFSCMTATLTSAVYTSILNCTRSKEVWDLLAKRFTSLSRSHSHQLKNKLQDVKKKGLTMEAYLEQIKAISDQLALAGSAIEDEDLILQTIKGLPDEYDAVKTSIRLRPFPLTMAELSSLLCSEAIHVEGSKKSNGTSELSVAFTMNKGQSSSSPDVGNNQFQNFNRGGRSNFRGHFRGGGRNSSYRGNRRGGRNYHYNSGFNGQNNFGQNNFGQQVPSSLHNIPTNAPVVCQICNKEHHSAVDCWYRLDTSYQSHTPNYHRGNTRAYYSSASSSSAPTQWYIDSAATNHMTNDLENLQIHQPYQGTDQVIVGNGNMLPIQNTEE